MSFNIGETAVTAQSRPKAEYTLELAQDLKAIHVLMPSKNSLTSFLARSLPRSTVKLFVLYTPSLALVLRTTLLTLVALTLTLTPTADGQLKNSRDLCSRLSDANAIAIETRRGGNFIITSADVASALAMSGNFDYTSGLTGAGGPSIGEVDDTGNLLGRNHERSH